MSTRMFIPTNRIPSAQRRFEEKMISVDPSDKQKPWNLQRRILPIVRPSVIQSRLSQESYLDRIKSLTNHEKKKPLVLVVKKVKGQLVPVLPMTYDGPKRRFKKIESVIRFAKELGREMVRVASSNNYVYGEYSVNN